MQRKARRDPTSGHNRFDVPVGRSPTIAPPTLTLTVKSGRVSVTGVLAPACWPRIVGVSFYPDAWNEKMPPNPLNGSTAGRASPWRCDRTGLQMGQLGARGSSTGSSGPDSVRRGDGVDVRVWVEHDGWRIGARGQRAMGRTTTGASDYQVCARHE